MSDLEALQRVVDVGGDWRDDVEVVRGEPSPVRLAMLADVLRGPAPGVTVPPMWTSVLTASWPAFGDLGRDGHPVTGVGYPPVPDRRRLFAGGRLRVFAPLALDAGVTRTSRVTKARAAEGRSGALLFVTLEHEFAEEEGQVVAVEEHDLAYRSGAAASSPSKESMSSAVRPADVELTPDAVTLFRFSALTGNSHRIHYDEPYAVSVEGLPGRLVHGPLLALLMLELPRRLSPDRVVASYVFRIARPVALGARLGVSRTENTGHRWSVELTADGRRSAEAEIIFADGDTIS